MRGWALMAAACSLMACSDDSGGKDSGVVDQKIGVDQKLLPDGAKPDGAKADAPPALTDLELAHSGKAIPNGGSYAVPDNMAANAIAIFSEQKDRMVITNKGAAAITIESIEIKGTAADAQAEEWRICDYSSAVNQCKAYTLGAVAPTKSFDFYLQFYPVASAARPATLTIKYKNAAGTQTFTATIEGKGRIGDDSLPAKLLTKGTLDFHKLWGGYDNNHDEFPGTMVADAAGNVYFAGSGTGLFGTKTSADRNIFVVKIKADKTLGWAKLYHSAFHDQVTSIDSGNSLTGAADAMTIDAQGNLYLTGSAANGSNTQSLMLVMKIDPATGAELWTRYWFGDTTRLQFTDAAQGFAVHVSNNLVFVTGKAKTATDQGMPVVAFGTDGSLKWSRIIVPRGLGTSAHEAHAIRADGKGNLFVAGIDKGTNGAAFLAKLKGVDAAGTTVALDWAVHVPDPQAGSNFNSMDLDAQGNPILAMDRRGAAAFFSVVKVTSDGKTIIGRTIPSDAANTGGTWNNIFVVRVAGTAVYAGGRIQTKGWDTGKGDGLFAKLQTSDLALTYAAVYYNGSGPNEVCAHSTHGIAVNGKDVYLMGQVYTGNLNFYRYWGYWYDHPVAAADFKPTTTDVLAASKLLPMPNAGLVSKTAQPTTFKNDGVYEDLPATTMGVEYQDATAKTDATHGSATDGDIFVMKVIEK